MITLKSASDERILIQYSNELSEADILKTGYEIPNNIFTNIEYVWHCKASIELGTTY